ncbi:MAG: HU family DNA-binding protein [Actinomycetota bacterium]|nr:HU family DNA-binding protein [Acidimicrobiia bacterium]MDQ3293164.1 HU family DNA-binding protein [Actinomycetota bacterium]
MNKAELIDSIAQRSGQSKDAVNAVLDAFEDVVVDSVKSGDKITLPGFLIFEKGHRAARTGKNPQTGEALEIKASDVAKVKIGSKFKSAVAG